MTEASFLSSWLATLLHTSEPTLHLTRRGTPANWERLGSSELRAGGRKGTNAGRPIQVVKLSQSICELFSLQAHALRQTVFIIKDLSLLPGFSLFL